MEKRNEGAAVIEKYSKVISNLLSNPVEENKASLGSLDKFEREVNSARRELLSKYRVAPGHAADPMPDVTREEIDQFISEWNSIDKLVSDAVATTKIDEIGYTAAEKAKIEHIASDTARDTRRAKGVLAMYKRSHKEEELPEVSALVEESHKKTLGGISQKLANIFNRRKH